MRSSSALCAVGYANPVFFDNGKVINGPASNFETRQRLNHVGEYRARRPAADIPGRLCGGGLAETPAVESDRDGVKIRLLGVCHKVPEFPCAAGGNGRACQTGNPPRTQCFSVQVMRLPRGSASAAEFAKSQPNPGFRELPALRKVFLIAGNFDGEYAPAGSRTRN